KIKGIIKNNNLNLDLGTIATVENLKPVIDIMVKLLLESVGIRPKSELFDYIVTNKNIKLDEDIKCISFSGGVADY
ncbi:ethanolamine ammonia-lyase reactivating factor EutA, partial [Casaltella massiliensis]|nr:ethanolamine ammonia-lyase reactivating factor EutA [Casaltella massiliensis]